MPKADFLLLLTTVVMTAGCATNNSTPTRRPMASVVSVGDLGQATRGATRFAFMPEGQIVPLDARLNTAQLEAEIQHTIRGILISRGYEFTTPDNADRLIGYAAALESNLSDLEIQRLVGFTPGSPSGDGLERGTVLLAISFPKSRRLLWSAGMQATADLSISDIERRQRVNNAIEQLLIGLPNRSN